MFLTEYSADGSFVDITKPHQVWDDFSSNHQKIKLYVYSRSMISALKIIHGTGPCSRAGKISD